MPDTSGLGSRERLSPPGRDCFAVYRQESGTTIVCEKRTKRPHRLHEGRGDYGPEVWTGGGVEFVACRQHPDEDCIGCHLAVYSTGCSCCGGVECVRPPTTPARTQP